MGHVTSIGDTINTHTILDGKLERRRKLSRPRRRRRMHLKQIGLESMDSLIWLRIRTSSGCREHDKENAAFHKRLGISSQRERLSCSVTIVSYQEWRDPKERISTVKPIHLQSAMLPLDMVNTAWYETVTKATSSHEPFRDICTRWEYFGLQTW
jgi:hypothetical protein